MKKTDKQKQPPAPIAARPAEQTVIKQATLTLPGPYIAVILRALQAGTYDLVKPIIDSIETQLKAAHTAPTDKPQGAPK